ncbi:hypothetical protein JCM21900_001334 [Sporobolomyces salmonicolor]
MSGSSDPNRASPVPVPRVIPGLSLPSAAPAAPKPRKRSSRHKVQASQSGPVLVGSVEGSVGDTPAELLPVSKEEDEQDLVVEDKKTSAVEAVQKRLRAVGKKLQRIETYEQKTEALNEDQRRAVASKPTLDAIVKELNELLVILKAEEAEDEARDKRVAAVEEKKQARAVEAAVNASKAESQSQLVLLFQFLHLHGLYSPQQSGFAPPVLPPVVAAADGQDVAAVRCLFDAFTNGPLLGGNGDALEKLGKIAAASTEDVLPGVSFARIQQLVHGLTSTPVDVPPTEEETIIESSAPAGPSDSVTALVDGAEESHHTPSFIQASELEPQEKVLSWADDIAGSAQAPPPSGPATPAAEIASISAPSSPATEVPSHPTPNGHIEPVAAPAEPAQTLDWAAEDEGAGELPSLPELAPSVPIVQSETATPAVPADGFQPARPPRRGSERGGPRGGSRGGEARRGSFRGGPRGGGAGNWEQRPPREEGASRGGRRGEGGRGRGGRGRGEGRGRGRGGANGAAHEPSPAAPATPQ